MSFLLPIGHVDIWALTATLYRQRASFKGEDGVSYIVVRDGAYRSPLLDKWVSLKNAIARANRIITTVHPELEMVKAELEQLDPGSFIPWQRGDGIGVHLALVTNPLAVLYSGIQAMTVAPGQVVAADQKAPHSAINLGDTPRIHLVLRLQRREDDEDR